MDFEETTLSIFSDEEMKKRAYDSLILADYSEEEIERWFEYNPESHEYEYKPEFWKIQDYWQRRNQIEDALYQEAIDLGIAYLYPSPAEEVSLIELLSQQEGVERNYGSFEAQPLWKRKQIIQQEKDNEHFTRLKKLSSLGLYSLAPGNEPHNHPYTINGITYFSTDSLFHHNEFIGLFYDECYFNKPPAPRKKHLDNLLRICKENKIHLLLVYYEKNHQPVWEIYQNGNNFVRRQSTPYSYEGYLFDRKKMGLIHQFLHGENKDDIASLQRIYSELMISAASLQNKEEQDIRIKELNAQQEEWFSVVSKMQSELYKIGHSIPLPQFSINGQIDEQSLSQYYHNLDAFSDGISLFSEMKYMEEAKKEYPFFEKVSPLSQRFLMTAVALEKGLSDDSCDICPLYFELCRVLENELDLRIYQDYIQKIKNVLEAEDKSVKVKVKEESFRMIRDYARKTKGDIFIPEKVKFKSLRDIQQKSETSSEYLLALYEMLVEKHIDIDVVSSEDDYNKNAAYVENRNKYVHPDATMDFSEERAKLEDIKRDTIERLNWLISATE